MNNAKRRLLEALPEEGWIEEGELHAIAPYDNQRIDGHTSRSSTACALSDLFYSGKLRRSVFVIGCFLDCWRSPMLEFRYARLTTPPPPQGEA